MEGCDFDLCVDCFLGSDPIQAETKTCFADDQSRDDSVPSEE